PAGLKSTIAEQVQAGWLQPRTARRLMAYPDLQAEENLASAAEDYLTMILDKMVDGMVEGEDDPEHEEYKGEEAPGLDEDYTAPGPEDDLQAASEMVMDYIQEGKVNGLSLYRLAMLDTFRQQVEMLKQTAMAAMAPPGGGGAPTAVPNAPPT